jgi:hypothetical protein
MGRAACTEPQCMYKGALHFYFTLRQKFQIEMYNCSDGMPSVFILIQIRNARCLNEAGLFFAHVTTHDGNAT